MLGIGRTHFENVRNHLASNGIIPRVHGNVNRITQSLTLLPAETSYKSVYRDFIATLKLLKYDAFRMILTVIT